MPDRMRHSFGLRGTQPGRCLDQMHLCGAAKPRHARRRPQHIRHQRTAPGAKFGQCEAGGRSLIQPDLCQRQPDQFAKHLADLGGSDEIAGGPKRLSGCIIPMDGVQQAVGHEIGHGDRPGCGDAGGNQPGQRGHAALRILAISHRPTAIIGKVKSCPMVSP